VINTLLGKISGFFDKEYLFASFLPSLIFLPLLALTFSLVVGVETVFNWIDSWSALQKTAAAATGSLTVVIFAYVLHALRSDFIRFWSGDSNFPLYLFWGFHQLGKHYQEWRFRCMCEKTRQESPWLSVLLDFYQPAVKKRWQSRRENLPIKERHKLLRILRKLHEGMSPEAVKSGLQPIIDAFDKYSGEDMKDIYR
jgi:hypothetical protein